MNNRIILVVEPNRETQTPVVESKICFKYVLEMMRNCMAFLQRT